MSDWIKVEKATLHKPEVLALSEALNIHPVHAFGLCVKFWMWCDDQILDGNARGVTKVTLDFVIGQPGMTDALLKVGWLRDRSGSLEVPHFDRHLSEGAKTRALTKERVRKSKEKSNDPTVTKVTQEPLLDKRREEYIAGEREQRACAPEVPQPPEREIPSQLLVLAHAHRIGLAPWKAEDWFNEMEACGWLDFQSRPIRNWQAALQRVKVKWEADGRPSGPPAAKNSPAGTIVKKPRAASCL